jgi:hypothetical protein
MSEEAKWPEEVRDWKCNHFSVNSKTDERQLDFLKRALELVEDLGNIDILDVSVKWYWTREAPNDGLEYQGCVSVYFSYNEDGEEGL